MFEDGPAPFFKRLQINSASIKFLKHQGFPSPDDVKKKKILNQLKEELNTARENRLKPLKFKEDYKKVHDYFSQNYAEKEFKLKFTDLNEILVERDEDRNLINNN